MSGAWPLDYQSVNGFFSAAFVTEFYLGIYERLSDLNISPSHYRQSDMLGFVAVWPSV